MEFFACLHAENRCCEVRPAARGTGPPTGTYLGTCRSSKELLDSRGSALELEQKQPCVRCTQQQCTAGAAERRAGPRVAPVPEPEQRRPSSAAASPRMPRASDAKVWNLDLERALQCRRNDAVLTGSSRQTTWLRGEEAIRAVSGDIYQFGTLVPGQQWARTGRIVGLPATLSATVRADDPTRDLRVSSLC